MEQKLIDAQLLEQVKNSDTKAFKTLFDRYQPILFRQVLFQTGEVDLSHDVVQETFIRIWKHRRSLKSDLSFLGYIFRISRNLIRDVVKHQKIRERSNEYLPAINSSGGDDPGEVLQLTMLQERITDIINMDLPDKCRETFLLSRYEGKTNREISDNLGISIRTVEHHISHALKVLRRKLSKYNS